MKLSFVSKSKIRTDYDFRNVLFNKSGRVGAIKTNFFSAFCRFNEFTYPRLGISISKKNIKTACERNRLKRIVRECFRLRQHKLNNFDVVFVVFKDAYKLENLKWRSIIEEQLEKLVDS